LLTLDKVKEDSLLKVVSISQGPFTSRLADMGLHDGSTVRVIYRAPFGDPLALEIGNFVLSLRKEEASFIQVERMDKLDQ